MQQEALKGPSFCLERKKRGSQATERVLFTFHSMLKPNRVCLLSAECQGMESVFEPHEWHWVNVLCASSPGGTFRQCFEFTQYFHRHYLIWSSGQPYDESGDCDDFHITDDPAHWSWLAGLTRCFYNEDSRAKWLAHRAEVTCSPSSPID